jgi:hypothetical protein
MMSGKMFLVLLLVAVVAYTQAASIPEGELSL